MSLGGRPNGDRRGFAPHTNAEAYGVHERDPVYYYPDGGVTFLVEGVLFKLQATLIMPPDSIAGDGSQRYPTGIENFAGRINSSNDTSPIEIPNITANQFRNYLFALLGRPSDPNYWALFVDAKAKEKHTRDLLIRYLDIASLSRQFGMSELEEWAASQLELVLGSAYNLAGEFWDRYTLLRLNFYARSSGSRNLVSWTTEFLQYFISISVAPEIWSPKEEHVSSNLDTCVQLYKEPGLVDDDPALFGCVFAAILSLGHRSVVWNSYLNRRDRGVLYAAQVRLISLSDEFENVNWLQSQLPPLVARELCLTCLSELENAWQDNLVEHGTLNSAVPLQDVTVLAQMPQHRRQFLSQWAANIARLRHQGINRDKAQHARHSSDSIIAVPKIFKAHMSPPQTDTNTNMTMHKPKCTALLWLLDHLDYHIQLAYQDLAERYKQFASES